MRHNVWKNIRWFAPGLFLLFLLLLLRGRFFDFLFAPIEALLDRLPASVFAYLLPALLLVALGIYYIRHMRYSRLRVYETLSPPLREEIDRERQASLQRKQKFLEAMHQAEGQVVVPKKENPENL